MSVRWWTCGECGSQVAVSAVVFNENDGPCIPARAARYESMRGELWDTSLLVGEKGLAMGEPRFCPGCGKKTLRAGWEYRFSPLAVHPDRTSRQLAHMMSEVNKAYDAFVRNERIFEEPMDNSHAVETGLRVPVVGFDVNVDIDKAWRGVIEKNSKRGYYGGDADEQG